MRGAGRGLSRLYPEIKLGHPALLKRIAVQPLAGLGVLAFRLDAIDVKIYRIPVRQRAAHHFGLDEKLDGAGSRRAILALFGGDERVPVPICGYPSAPGLHDGPDRGRIPGNRDGTVKRVRHRWLRQR